MTVSGKIRRKKEPASPCFWEKMNLVAQISTRCRAAADTRQTYVEVLELIQRIVPHDAATLYLLDSDGEHLAEKATVGKRVEIMSFLSLGTGKGLSGWSARSKKPVLLNERSNRGNFDPAHDFATVMSVPLLVEDDVLGVLNLGCRKPRALDEKHVALMTIVVNQFAVAIERLAHKEKMEAKSRELEQVHEELRTIREKITTAERLSALAEDSVSINHEINNPLSVIIGNVQCILMQKSVPDQKALSRLKRIEAAAIKISEVNRRLLRIDSQVNGEEPSGDKSRAVSHGKSVSG